MLNFIDRLIECGMPGFRGMCFNTLQWLTIRMTNPHHFPSRGIECGIETHPAGTRHHSINRSMNFFRTELREIANLCKEMCEVGSLSDSFIIYRPVLGHVNALLFKKSHLKFSKLKKSRQGTHRSSFMNVGMKVLILID